MTVDEFRTTAENSRISAWSPTGSQFGPNSAARSRTPSSPGSAGIAVKKAMPSCVVGIAVALWVSALPALRETTSGEYGLLASPGGIGLIAAVGIAILAFISSLAAEQYKIAAFTIAVIVLFERVTVTLITEVPIYTWTYKHIGLVDYIQANGALAPSSVDIYNRWPGFFTMTAWFCSATGLDPVVLAHCFAPIVHVLLAFLVGMLAHALGATTRVALTAAMLAEILNWVGQDYFSPQATGLVLAIGVLVLLVHSKRHPMAGYLSIVVFAALVCTHQLTPYWICAVAVALALLKKIQPLWLPAVYALILAIYLLPRLDSVTRYGLFTGSNPVSNASSNIASRGSDGRVFTMLVDRSLSLTMWTLAMVAFVVLARRHASPLVAGVIAFSAMGLLGAQSYGGEAIFRVYLYSIAGCAILIAPIVVSTLSVRRRGFRTVSNVFVAFLLIVLATAGLQGYYGGWAYVTINRTQLEQSRELLAANDGAATITTVAPAGWPERSSAAYVPLAQANPTFDRPLIFLKQSLSQGFPSDGDIDRLGTLARADGHPFYVVLPSQMTAYSDYFGLFAPGAIVRLVEKLSSHPEWERVIDDANTVVFRFSENGGI